MRNAMCIGAAVVFLAGSGWVAGADVIEPGAPATVVYYLRSGSTEREGCFPPDLGDGTCGCPVRGGFDLRGTFRVAVNAPTTGSQMYTVTSAHLRVPAIGRTFDGDGRYQSSNVAPPSGRLDLNMTFDRTGEVVRWNSDSSGVVSSPVVRATLVSAPACFNMVLTIRATSLLSDWNADGQVTVGDLFLFLKEWFAGDGDADDNGATTVQDLFTFLRAWMGAA